jgi:hypothetical protein
MVKPLFVGPAFPSARSKSDGQGPTIMLAMQVECGKIGEPGEEDIHRLGGGSVGSFSCSRRSAAGSQVKVWGKASIARRILNTAHVTDYLLVYIRGFCRPHRRPGRDRSVDARREKTV